MRYMLLALSIFLAILPRSSRGDSHSTGGVALGAAYPISRISVDGSNGIFAGFVPGIMLSASVATGTSTDLRLGVDYSYWSLTNTASAVSTETLKGHSITPQVSCSYYSVYLGVGVRTVFLDLSSTSSSSTYFGIIPTAEAGLSLILGGSGAVVLPTLRVSHGSLSRTSSEAGGTMTAFELSARIRFAF